MTSFKALAIASLFVTGTFATTVASAQLKNTQPKVVVDCVPNAPVSFKAGAREITAVEGLVLSSTTGIELKTRYKNPDYGIEQRTTSGFVQTPRVVTTALTFVPDPESVEKGTALDVLMMAFKITNDSSIAKLPTPFPAGNYPIQAALGIVPKSEKSVNSKDTETLFVEVNLSCLYKVSY